MILTSRDRPEEIFLGGGNSFAWVAENDLIDSYWPIMIS
jgi:hypothetical protein